MKRSWMACCLGIVCLLAKLGFAQGFGGATAYPPRDRFSVDGISIIEAMSNVAYLESRVTFQGAEVSEKQGIGLVVAKKLINVPSPNMGGATSRVTQYTVVVPAFLVQKEAAFNLVAGELEQRLTFSTVNGAQIFETESNKNGLSIQIDNELAFISFTLFQGSPESISSISATKYQKILKETEAEKTNSFAITFNSEFNAELVRKFEAKVQSNLIGIPDGCLLVNERQTEGIIVKEKLYTIPELISRFIALKTKEDPFTGDGQQLKLKAAEYNEADPFYSAPQGKEDPFNDGDPQVITKGAPSSPNAARDQNPQIAAILKIIQTTKNKETKEKTEQTLRALLEEEFDTVVAKNETEIAALTDRLQALKNAEEERKQNRKKIIDERLHSLMNTSDKTRR